MSLTHVWLRTPADGLVRGDQVVGIDVHQTPQLTGKRSHWLIDVLLPAPVGSGVRGEWDLTMLHRTLVQTSQPPGDAATVLARLLASSMPPTPRVWSRSARIPSRTPVRRGSCWRRTAVMSRSASCRSPARPCPESHFPDVSRPERGFPDAAGDSSVRSARAEEVGDLRRSGGEREGVLLDVLIGAGEAFAVLA